jgi:hypothetical protein
MLRAGIPLDDLRATFSERGSIRIDGFLDGALVVALRDASRALEHELRVSIPDDLAYQYWSAKVVPEEHCDHLLCRFGRWLWSDGAAWIGALTGIELMPPPGRTLVTTLFDKGSHLDPHNDWDGTRKVAFVLGLTEETWPAEDGGHLEFLDTDGKHIVVVESRPPGWNTLDLFDVRQPTCNHAIPILRRRAERRVISGWFC